MDSIPCTNDTGVSTEFGKFNSAYYTDMHTYFVAMEPRAPPENLIWLALPLSFSCSSLLYEAL